MREIIIADELAAGFESLGPDLGAIFATEDTEGIVPRFATN